MRTVLSLMFMAGLATAMVQADQTKETLSPGGDGVAILEKAREAMKSLKSVRYKADYRATGWLTEFVPNVQGEVLLAGQSQWKIDRFFCTVTVRPPKEENAQNLTAGCDGDVYFLINPLNQTAYEDMDAAVLGSNGRAVTRIVVSGLTSGDPLVDERKAQKVELKEDIDIAGESCHQVLVTLPDGGRQVVWYFSKKDYLPRRYDRLNKNPKGEEGSTQLLLTGLETNPKIEGNPFKLSLPAGFAKSDQFAE